MQKKNGEYYIDITSSFALFFQNQISEMKMKALNISFETRNHLLPFTVFNKKDPYYYKECVDELAKYRMQDPHLYNIGIFYYGEPTFHTFD